MQTGTIIMIRELFVEIKSAAELLIICSIIELKVLPVEYVRYEKIIPENIAYIIPPRPLCIRAKKKDDIRAAGINPNLLSTRNTLPLQNSSSQTGTRIPVVIKTEVVNS